MKNVIVALAGLAIAGSALGQISITPNANGNASTTNGMFQIASVPGTPNSAVAFAGNSFFSATTSAAANDNVYAYHWLWHVNTSAGSTQDTRELIMSNGSGGGVNSFMTVTGGNNLGNSTTAQQSFDIFNVNNGYSFLAVSNYSIINTGAGPQVVNTMTITNRDSGPLSLSLYNYFDGAINNGDANDTVTYDAGTGAFNWSDTALPGRTIQHIGYGANRYQASAWASATPGTVTTELGDTGRDDLNNTVVTGAGDRAAAFQWDLNFAPGETRTIIVGLGLNTNAIPAPAGVAAFGLMGLAGLRRRRA
jgi:hypothetical protein